MSPKHPKENEKPQQYYELSNIFNQEELFLIKYGSARTHLQSRDVKLEIAFDSEHIYIL